MRYLSIVLSLLIFPSIALAHDKLTPRPLDPVAVETFARATEGSAKVRALVERLEASNVIVHIETRTPMPAGLGGMTQFVTSRGGYRYLRITLGSDLTLGVRSAILGHELQHACEIAESSAADVESLRKLFEHVGHRDGEFFETMKAIKTERTVLAELRASRSLQTEPITKFDH
jgi:hypothetical protein